MKPLCSTQKYPLALSIRLDAKGACKKNAGMARLDSETSNTLFEVLADWNAVLEHRESFDSPVPLPNFNQSSKLLS